VHDRLLLAVSLRQQLALRRDPHCAALDESELAFLAQVAGLLLRELSEDDLVRADQLSQLVELQREPTGHLEV